MKRLFLAGLVALCLLVYAQAQAHADGYKIGFGMNITCSGPNSSKQQCIEPPYCPPAPYNALAYPHMCPYGYPYGYPYGGGYYPYAFPGHHYDPWTGRYQATTNQPSSSTPPVEGIKTPPKPMPPGK